MFKRLLAYLLASLVVAGCASGRTNIKSRADVDNVAPISRLFILVNMKSKFFSERAYDGFQSALRGGLSNCSVNAEVMHTDPLELDPNKRLAEANARFRPDSMMTIKAAGGSVTTGSGGSSSALIFELKIRELKSNRLTWDAKSQFSYLTGNLFTDDRASGERFATQTITQLRADGVLGNCPVVSAR